MTIPEITPRQRAAQRDRVLGSLLIDDSRLTFRTVYPARRPRQTPDLLGRLVPRPPEGPER